MNQLRLLITLVFVFSAGEQFAGSVETNRLLIPFLDPRSQSNVVVTVSELQGSGRLCPLEVTNVVSNTNLFTSKERELLEQVSVKYRDVTTNSGPPGSILLTLDKTNCVIPIVNVTNAFWRAVFWYTNLGAYEEVVFVPGLSARFESRSGDGYIVGFGNVAGHLSMVFEQTTFGVANGLRVECNDMQRAVGRAGMLPTEFTNQHVTTYQHLTNGLTIGKYFMWNPSNNNLVLQAEFKEPYDMKEHSVAFPPR